MVVAGQEHADTAEAPAALGEYRQRAFPGLGTTNELLYRAVSAGRARAFEAAAVEWIRRFEARFSRFRPDSLIGRINAAAGGAAVETDAEADELFALCDWFHWRTGGLFDPTSGPLVELWDYRRAEARPPSEVELEAARARVGWKRVERSAGRIRLPVAGMRIDLGGIGKEYAVDRLVKLAGEHGIVDVAVSLGRDIRVAGSPPEGGAWRIGMEHPGEPDRCWGGVALEDSALCCSGDYRRYFKHGGRRYGHLLDPRTGRPAENGCRAIWVVAPSCTEAGALATAAFIAGPEEGAAMVEASHHAAACFWTDRGIMKTRRFERHVIPD